MVAVLRRFVCNFFPERLAALLNNNTGDEREREREGCSAHALYMHDHQPRTSQDSKDTDKTPNRIDPGHLLLPAAYYRGVNGVAATRSAGFEVHLSHHHQPHARQRATETLHSRRSIKHKHIVSITVSSSPSLIDNTHTNGAMGSPDDNAPPLAFLDVSRNVPRAVCPSSTDHHRCRSHTRSPRPSFGYGATSRPTRRPRHRLPRPRRQGRG